MTEKQPPRFCAVDSAKAGDPLAGTATHAGRMLLISWPRRTWTRSLRQARDMSHELLDQIETLVAGGRRVNLITRRDQPAELHRLILYPEARAFDVHREQLPRFLADMNAGHCLDRWAGQHQLLPVMLCCTHGKKDKCCAKFGYDTYRRLDKAIQQQAMPMELWESSHLGGCRLAASVLVLPSLRKYGRIAPVDITPLLACETANRPYLPCFRGHGGLSPAQQCAEIAVLERLSARGITATTRVDAGESRGESRAIVPVHWHSGEASGTLVAHCEVRTIQRIDTCADLEEGPTPSLCWFAVHVETVNDPVESARESYQSSP